LNIVIYSPNTLYVTKPNGLLKYISRKLSTRVIDQILNDKGQILIDKKANAIAPALRVNDCPDNYFLP